MSVLNNSYAKKANSLIIRIYYLILQKKVMKQLTFLLLFIFTVTSIHAQSKQYNIWYFGEKAGIDFNNTPPTALLDNPINTDEGTATIADEDGVLLFYTNGEKVFNKELELMENGDSLYGHKSSSTSVVVVPKHHNDSIYYLFTVDAAYSFHPYDGFNYSIVDMTYNNGLGKVTEKNIALRDTVTEHLMVIPHSNGIDYWVVVHGLGNNIFYAYLFNENGLFGPVTSAVGTVTYEEFFSGQSQASPDGSRIAIASQKTDWLDYVELYDFDRTTGKISNPIHISSSLDKSYGVEFSPDGNYLYRTVGNNKIIQHKVNENSVSSGIIISEGTQDLFGHLQLGPDNKIYFSRYSYDQVGVIHNPNEEGLACNLAFDGPDMNYNECYLGLPTNIQPHVGFQYEQNCIDHSVDFYGSFATADSVLWNFGDGVTSMDLTTNHIFSDTGNYQVTLEIYEGSDTTNFTSNIYVPETIAAFDIGNDTTLCEGDTLVLYSPQSFLGFIDGNGIQYDSAVFTNSGMKEILVYNGQGCVFSDSIFVNFDNGVEVDLEEEIIFCEDEDVLIETNSTFQTYLWSDNSNASSLLTNQAGWYRVTVTNQDGCISSDSILLELSDILPVDLGPDIFFCENGSYIIEPTNNFLNYLWNEGSIDHSIFVNQSGIYWVSVEDQNGCESSDTIQVETYPLPQINLGNDTLIHLDSNLVLDVGAGFSSYIWSDGSLGETFNFIPTSVGVFTISVNVTDNNGCTSMDQIEITVDNPSSLNNLWLESRINIFPNPNNGFFKIELNENVALPIQLEMIDLNGKFIFGLEKNETVFEINAEALPKGIYFLKIKNGQGVFLDKIILE